MRLGGLVELSMTSNYIMNKPQRDVECFRNPVHGHAALGVKADHSGQFRSSEKAIAEVCLEGPDERRSG